MILILTSNFIVIYFLFFFYNSSENNWLNLYYYIINFIGSADEVFIKILKYFILKDFFYYNTVGIVSFFLKTYL